MKLLLVTCVLCHILSILCDVVYLKTGIYMFEIFYRVGVPVANILTVVYLIKNAKMYMLKHQSDQNQSGDNQSD